MNVPPPLGQALEWADSKAEAQRWQTLRYSIFCGWHSEWRPEAAAAPEAPYQRIAATLLGRR